MRQLAKVLNTTHTTISNLMKELGIEGQSQGPGKAVLLSPGQQRLISEAHGRGAKPDAPQVITEAVGCEIIQVDQPDAIDYFVPDASLARLAMEARVLQTTEMRAITMGKMRQAILARAAEQGAQLAVEAHVMFHETMTATATKLEQGLAQKTGLVRPSAEQDSAGDE